MSGLSIMCPPKINNKMNIDHKLILPIYVRSLLILFFLPNDMFKKKKG